MTRRIAWAVALCAAVCLPSTAHAQAVAFRGYGEAGATRFAASQSFKAVLGSPTGIIYGGGIDVVVAQHVFVDVGASRFQKDGSRVFVSNGQVFDLGIPTTIRITPVELSAGYRFSLSSPSIVPYAGGGIGWHRYEESSSFATASENVKDTFRGYQVLGGVEFRVNGWFGVDGQAKYVSVPNAIGQDPNSASSQFGEKNLGGATFVVKAVLGK